MEKAVDSAQIDEGAVLGEAADGPGDDVALADLGVAAVLVGALLLLGEHAAVDDDILVGDVELDDADAELLADQFAELGGVAGAAAGGGHEGAGADVDGEAAFDHGGDGAENGLLVGKGLLQQSPLFRLSHFEQREFVIPLGVAGFQRDLEFVADLGVLDVGQDVLGKGCAM